jgi:hypothetical protein
MTNNGNGAMTKSERQELAKVVRMRAKAAKNGVDQRASALRADVEEQLATKFDADHELWKQAVEEAKVVVNAANAKIQDRCEELGVWEKCRPSLSIGWAKRGENALAERRVELRRVAYTRIDERARQAKFEIDAWAADTATRIIAGGLESAEAAAFLNGMTEINELMPRISLPELGEVQTKTERLMSLYSGVTDD